MFILSQAIIPVFVFAVLVNFYNIDPIFSEELPETFDSCDKCIQSTCHKTDNGTCAVGADNSTMCIKCLEQDQQFNFEADCKLKCNGSNTCVCEGTCYVCRASDQDVSNSTECKLPTEKWSEDCSTAVPYEPAAEAAASSEAAEDAASSGAAETAAPPAA